MSTTIENAVDDMTDAFRTLTEEHDAITWPTMIAANALDSVGKARERVEASLRVSESEINALIFANAQSQIVGDLVRDIQAQRVVDVFTACCRLGEYAGFLVPENGGTHGLIAVRRAQFAIELQRAFLSVLGAERDAAAKAAQA